MYDIDIGGLDMPEPSSLITIPRYISFGEISTILGVESNDVEKILGSLRKLYVDNFPMFEQILTILKLKGLCFSDKLNSRVFSNWGIQTSKIIKVSEDNQLYLNLFNLMNVEYFLVKLGVVSDLFFNNISVECLSYYLNRDLEFVLRIFGSAGFEIVSIDKNNVEDPSIDLHNDDELGLRFEEIWLISDVFLDSKFALFKKFCETNSVLYVNEITDSFLSRYSRMPYVGRKKVLDIKERLMSIEYESENDIQPIKKAHIVGEFENTHIVERLVNVLLNNKFRMSCDALEIDYSSYFDRILDIHIEEEDFILLNNEIEEISVSNEDAMFKVKLTSKINLIIESESGKYFKPILIKNLISFDTDEEYQFNEFNFSEICLRDLHNYIDLVPHSVLKSLMIRLESLLYDISHIDRFKPDFSSDQIRMIECRENGDTLEVVGEIFGVTRERVRQVIRKCYDNSIKYIEAILDVYKPYTDHFKLISVSSLEVLVPNESFVFTHFLKTYLLDNRPYKRIKGSIFPLEFEDILELLLERNQLSYFDYSDNSGGIVRKSDIQDYINGIGAPEYSQSIKEELYLYLQYLGYNETNELFHKNIGYKEKFVFILQNDFSMKSKIGLDEFGFIKGINNLKRYFADENYKDYTLDSRAMYTRISDAWEFGVLRASQDHYELIDIDAIDLNGIIFLEGELNEMLSKTNYITAFDIFDDHKNTFISYGISNEYYLYSLVNYFLRDRFKIGYHNTMSISLSKSTQRVSKTRLVIDYLELFTEGRSKKHLVKKFKFDEIGFAQNVVHCPEILSYIVEKGEMNCILLKYISITEELKTTILKEVDRLLEFQGYIFTKSLFDSLVFGKRGKELIDSGIDTMNKLSSLIKLYYPNLKGQANLIYPSGNFVKLYDVVLKEFPYKLSYDELSERLMDCYGYSRATVDFMIQEIEALDSYLDTGGRRYVKTETLNLEMISIEFLDEIINDQIQDRPFISLEELDDTIFTDVISHKGLTPILLMNILRVLNYKVLKTGIDYRYPCMILVSEKNCSRTITDIVEDLIDNYSGELYIPEITQFYSETKIMIPSIFITGLESSEKYHIDGYNWIRRKVQ